VNAHEPQQQKDFDQEIDEIAEEGSEHEYAVYLRLHEDRRWPPGALQTLLADLHATHPRLEQVDAPRHDVVISVDGDGLDAQGAARHAVARVTAAAQARGLSGHAADVTVLSDNAVWTYDKDEVAGW
jgi:hypothetical protein